MHQKPAADKMVTWRLLVGLLDRLRDYQYAHRLPNLTVAGRHALDAGIREWERSASHPAPSESAPERSGELSDSAMWDAARDHARAIREAWARRE